RFGGPGLAACNPLLAFQLMNNFTMCHAAIQEGIGGPSGALFSRGAGTIAALAAARRSVEDGDCAIAIAGGADSALHPVTWAELVRDGRAVVPGEGCGLIAIADDDRFPALATLCTVASFPLDGEGELAATIGAAIGPDAEEIVIAVGADANAVRGMVAAHAPAARIHDLGLGEALAATPALAWLAALDRIRLGARRVVTLTIGVDGDLGVVTLEAP
ncbi:MAG: hypothetical protein K8W52_05350, partial [Deltaproteobacteria bacterium]|nr:hypothetical protein [Deltaproteobacteria bacterium]